MKRIVTKGQHTQGPWTVGSLDSNGWPIKPLIKAYYDDRRRPMAHVNSYVNPTHAATALADAKLIASAPEMLEALELADAALSGADVDMHVVRTKVRCAMMKARGQ